MGAHCQQAAAHDPSQQRVAFPEHKEFTEEVGGKAVPGEATEDFWFIQSLMVALQEPS
jgi:hypothetical protein